LRKASREDSEENLKKDKILKKIRVFLRVSISNASALLKGFIVASSISIER